MKTRSEVFQIADQIEWEIVGEGVKRKLMAYDGHLTMVYVDFMAGSVAAIHNHYHSQGTLVVSGKFEVTVGDKIQIISSGDGFYAEPDIPHGVKCVEAGVLLDVFTPMRADFVKK